MRTALLAWLLLLCVFCLGAGDPPNGFQIVDQDISDLLNSLSGYLDVVFLLVLVVLQFVVARRIIYRVIK